MSMRTNIFTKNLELTEAIRQYIQKKTSRLDRYLNDINEIRVDVSYSKTARASNDRHIAQITLHGRGFILRAEERSDDLYSAIDLVTDKVQRQIERYKGKRERGITSGKPIKEYLSDVEGQESVREEDSPIVRRKKFKLTPMDELEAIEQMKQLGHEDFFIFYNLKSNAINVLYRRRDGTYGLIEPLLE
jgi:putative sigma-54 modulation protein